MTAPTLEDIIALVQSMPWKLQVAAGLFAAFALSLMPIFLREWRRR